MESHGRVGRDEDLDSRASGSEVAATAASTIPGEFTALLVEDDPHVAVVLAEAFADDGRLKVMLAQDGASALQAMEANPPPSVAVIDVWLCGASSLAVAGAAAARGIPFVFTTGDPVAADMVETCELTVLRKPYRIPNLISRAHAAAQLPRGTAAAGDLRRRTTQRLRELRERLVSSGL
jgi:DNA-binding NtrC family response regulator